MGGMEEFFTFFVLVLAGLSNLTTYTSLRFTKQCSIFSHTIWESEQIRLRRLDRFTSLAALSKMTVKSVSFGD